MQTSIFNTKDKANYIGSVTCIELGNCQKTVRLVPGNAENRLSSKARETLVLQ